MQHSEEEMKGQGLSVSLSGVLGSFNTKRKPVILQNAPAINDGEQSDEGRGDVALLNFLTRVSWGFRSVFVQVLGLLTWEKEQEARDASW